MGLLSYRNVVINEAQSLHGQDQERRRRNEYSVYRSGFSIQAGLLFGRHHTLYGAYNNLEQGFAADGQSVQWSTGLPVAGSGEHYRFAYKGVELGYRYSGDSRKINGVLEAGLYHHWEQERSGSRDLEQAETIRNITGVKGALGLNWRPWYRFEVLVLPTVYFNLSPTARGALTTRLLSRGITIGAGWYLINRGR
jgi:hypothetical protein